MEEHLNEAERSEDDDRAINRRIYPIRDDAVCDLRQVVLGPLKMHLYAIHWVRWYGFVEGRVRVLSITIMMIHAADMVNQPKMCGTMRLQ